MKTTSVSAYYAIQNLRPHAKSTRPASSKPGLAQSAEVTAQMKTLSGSESQLKNGQSRNVAECASDCVRKAGANLLSSGQTLINKIIPANAPVVGKLSVQPVPVRATRSTALPSRSGRLSL